MSEFSDNNAMYADGCVVNFSERGSVKPAAGKGSSARKQVVPARKAKAYVLAAESGRVVLNAKQFGHFEECMTKPTTTASGMVVAAAQMLEFSKQSRR